MAKEAPSLYNDPPGAEEAVRANDASGLAVVSAIIRSLFTMSKTEPKRYV